ncbi:PQQ-binding-like beta-propeller repeat protein [Nocardiopsis gilva]|uniref:PQQ-binding-like beta-propeller repeat protein n=1 Tax=Nocardiopsis gilva TaxID=280236 RepID=UPI0012678913|nr:PQQ-binding-like beta-propeller repeat protein [Nocardiopsis gilva]
MSDDSRRRFRIFGARTWKCSALAAAGAVVLAASALTISSYVDLQHETVIDTGTSPDDARQAFTQDDLESVASFLRDDSTYGELRRLIPTRYGTVALMDNGAISVDNDTLKIRWSYLVNDKEVSANVTDVSNVGFDGQRVVLAFDSFDFLGNDLRVVAIDVKTGELVSESACSKNIAGPGDVVRWVTAGEWFREEDDSKSQEFYAYSLESGEQQWSYSLPIGCSVTTDDRDSKSVLATQRALVLSYSCSANETVHIVTLDRSTGEQTGERTWSGSDAPSLAYVDTLSVPGSASDAAGKMADGGFGKDYAVLYFGSRENEVPDPWKKTPELDDISPSPIKDSNSLPQTVVIGDGAFIDMQVPLRVAHRLLDEGVLNLDDAVSASVLVEDPDGEKKLPVHPVQWQIQPDETAINLSNLISDSMSAKSG